MCEDAWFLRRSCGIMECAGDRKGRPYAEEVALPSHLRRKGGHALGLPKRKQIRLPDYDYSTPGAYFVTICTQDRRCILSDIRRGDPCGRPSPDLTEYGIIVEQCLKQAESLYAVQIEPYVIMPNHIHFICRIDQVRATARVAPTLGRIVGALKSLAANQCRRAGLKGTLWQRGYYEHVIRGEEDSREIWAYIDENPARWADDRYYQTE